MKCGSAACTAPSPLAPAGLLDASAMENLAAEEDSDKARVLGLAVEGACFAHCFLNTSAGAVE